MNDISNDFGISPARLLDERTKLAPSEEQGLSNATGSGARSSVLAEMLEQERAPLDFRAVDGAIEAKLAARDAQEDHEQRRLAQRIVSGVGPFIINDNQEKSHGW